MCVSASFNLGYSHRVERCMVCNTNFCSILRFYFSLGTPLISVYKRYGVVLFEGVVQLKLFSETEIKPFHSVTVRVNIIILCINLVLQCKFL